MDPTTLVYLLIAILSYFGSRKAGLSKGKSALVAAGVTGLAYKYDIGDKVTDFFSGDSVDVPLDDVATPPGGSWLDKSFDFIGNNAGKLAAGVVGLGAASGGFSTAKKYWPWLLGGLVLFLTTRKE